MARLRKKKLPCVRRLRSTTNARMTRALPNTVASTSSPMSTASSAAVAAAKGPPRCPSAAQPLPAARGPPEWLSHGTSWPMAAGGEPALRRSPARLWRSPRAAVGTAPAPPQPPPGGGRGGRGAERRRGCSAFPAARPAPRRCWDGAGAAQLSGVPPRRCQRCGRGSPVPAARGLAPSGARSMKRREVTLPTAARPPNGSPSFLLICCRWQGSLSCLPWFLCLTPYTMSAALSYGP